MLIKDLIKEYITWLKVAGRSPKTVKGRTYDLNRFMIFLTNADALVLEDLTGEVMREYQEDLAFSLSKKGKPLALRSQALLLGVAKNFTKYLKENDYLLHDPGESIIVPRKPRRLPRVIMKEREMNILLKHPDTQTNYGYRDRIILEILYDTAIRRAELKNMLINDMDLESGYIRINGKGNKDRVVPISRHVCQLVSNYISMIRPNILGSAKDTGHLILNRWGRKMAGKGIWEVIKKHSNKAKIKHSITTHTLRHTCATHMLNKGAPIRHLQEMLGHESLESTQVYTHVTISDLKKVHDKYHPGDSLDL